MHIHYSLAAQQFLNYLKFEKRYSQHTIISYTNDLEQFFQYLGAQYDAPAINDISTAFIRSWLAALKNENITAKSINRKISTLRSFFKYQMKRGELVSDPIGSINGPKVPKRLPSFVSEKDMETLHTYVEMPDTWKGRTDKLLLELFYNTGMRLSELISLKDTSIDLANRQLKVLGKGNKERIIPISASLIDELKKYINEKKLHFPELEENCLLVNAKGKALYPKYVYLIVKQNLSLVTTIQKKSPHILRHTFATHLANNGADLNAVKELLGHSSLASTQVYTHNSIDKLKDVYKKAHPKA